MNAPAQKDLSSPRPIPEGQETRTFRDTQPGNAQETSHLEKSSKAMANAREGSPPSSPPAWRWGRGLNFLLDDHQGSLLFREFLRQEGHEIRSLDFCFAARGLKKPEANDTQKCIPLIYSKMVLKIPLISQATKDEILRKISSGGVLGVDMFDAAQEEVEEYMRRTTYPNFLRSDMYIQQLQGLSPNPVEEVGGDLQTLHEDRELNFPLRKIESSIRFWSQKKNRGTAKSKTEAQTVFLKSPCAPYHTTYAPFLPASARDSEVQSLSSGVTDESMPQSNNSLCDPNVYRKQKYQQKPLYKLPINFEAEKITFIPDSRNRDRQCPPDEAMLHTRPEEFANLLTKKLEEAQRQMEKNETLNKKLESIEPSIPPYIPEEENDQSILDHHVDRVFPGQTPSLLSPACATPPAPAAVKCNPRLQTASWCMADSTQEAARASPFAAPFAGKVVKRDSDTRSNDSGALADWISADNLRLAHSDSAYEARREKLAREKLQRSKKLALAGSSTSFFDSGVSMTYESVQPVHTKVTNSLEPRRCSSEAENDRRGKNSPDLARSSRKTASYAYSLRVPDPSQCPASQPGELPSHDTAASLRETCRILEDETRNKSGKSKYTGRNAHEATRGKVSSRACDATEEGLSHRKQSKKSTGSSGESTIVGYSYGLGSTPFKSKLEGKNPTLKQFKTLLNKRGNFRYFFKSLSDDFGTVLVYDEVTDDHAPLPLWEGKVFCVIEAMDDQGGERNTAAWSQ